MRLLTSFLIASVASAIGFALAQRMARSEVATLLDQFVLEGADGEDAYLMGIQTEAGLVEVEGKFPFLGAVWPPTCEEGEDHD